MSYSAQAQKCTQLIGVPFGRGRLIRKERMRWFVQVLDNDGKEITLPNSTEPFIVRLFNPDDQQSPLGLTVC